ncbi:F-box associated domain [Macleaya cordata]|uniref:F-box associated domain n=1 Tax=Macleaya cordata TaxID=56857 RepID=A0A200PSB4_MACCD|nr:F-box associated domain [Macleaya cordata]
MELNKGFEVEEQQVQDSMVSRMGIEEEECVDEMHTSSDSIYEILTRVSNDTLFRRWRWVYKDWKKLIYDTNFKLNHLEKTQTISGYFIRSLELGEYRSSFVSIFDNPQVPSLLLISYHQQTFHWLTNDGRIFVFNVDEENWTTIELPEEQVEMNDNCFVRKKLVDCEGKLAMLYTGYDNWMMELWLLKEGSGNHIWKKYNVNLESLSRDTEYISLLDMYSPDTALMTYYDKIAWYNCRDRRYITAKLLPRISSFGQVFTFQSDLTTCGLSDGWF